MQSFYDLVCANQEVISGRVCVEIDGDVARPGLVVFASHLRGLQQADRRCDCSLPSPWHSTARHASASLAQGANLPSASHFHFLRASPVSSSSCLLAALLACPSFHPACRRNCSHPAAHCGFLLTANEDFPIITLNEDSDWLRLGENEEDAFVYVSCLSVTEGE